jgi:UrcA family protein
MNVFITLISAAAIATAAAAPLQAEEAQSIRVATRDLDLSTARGHKLLSLRVSRAAHKLCDVSNERFDARVRISQRQCREDAIASALGKASLATRIVAR